MLRLTSAGGDAFSKEKMRDAFDMVDMNKSNSLDGNEVFQAIRKLEANLSEVRLANVDLTVCTNGTGDIQSAIFHGTFSGHPQ